MHNGHHGICPQTEQAELYAMGRLGPARLARFEEHLLVCGACQEMVDFTDEFLTLLRHAEQPFEIRPAAVASLKEATGRVN